MTARTVRRHRWSATPRNGRRFSSTAWRWAVSFDVLMDGRTVARKTERGHARTKRRALRSIEEALAR